MNIVLSVVSVIFVLPFLGILGCKLHKKNCEYLTKKNIEKMRVMEKELVSRDSITTAELELLTNMREYMDNPNVYVEKKD